MAFAVLLVGGLAACENLTDLTELEVENQNNPDTERALANAADVEALIGSAFETWHDASQQWAALMYSAVGDELSLSWGNAAIRDQSSEPRVAFNSDPSYTYAYVGYSGNWQSAYGAISAVYDALRAFDANPALGLTVDVDRARAFGKFIQGLSHGWLALSYDSAFILDETVDIETDELAYLPYPDVMAAALGYLNEAITLAQGGSWSLPSTWINGNPLSGPELAQVAHSYAARFLAQVGRSSADRAALAGLAPSWQTVIDHVNNGITSDLEIEGDGASLWQDRVKWGGAQVGRTWGRADYKTIGYTDTSGEYAAWLATPFASRDYFEIDTPDLRIAPGPPPHTEFVTVGLDFGMWGRSNHPEARGTYHWSYYGHERYKDWNESSYTTQAPIMKVAEMDMLKAEGLVRLGQGGAAALVNNTRVTRGGLPAATDADADLMDKIMYEMQIENFIVCGGCAYYNRRGWDGLQPTGPNHHFGLVEGTMLHFPLPGAEAEILQKKRYTYGGVGQEGTVLQPSGAAPFSAAAAAGTELPVTRVPASLVYQFNRGMTIPDKLEALQADESGSVGALLRYR
jgi:hypothetical protein